MYFESWLKIDADGHPARPRPARELFRNAYVLHQRIASAFGRDPRRDLAVEERVPRGENPSWSLYRVMAATRSVLVRSGQRPDWPRAFRKHSDRDLWLHLAEPPDVQEVASAYSSGQTLRFSLRANPTVKKKRTPGEGQKRSDYRVPLCYPRCALAFLDRHTRETTDEERRVVAEVGADGHDLRRAVVDRALRCWLSLKGEAGGFRVEASLPIQEGERRLWRPAQRTKGGREPDMTYRSVLYEGLLQVTDAEAFGRTLCSGIGPGKAFGFGLLSVAPYR
jgi:CRISPR system Cascade subunit CasE